MKMANRKDTRDKSVNKRAGISDRTSESKAETAGRRVSKNQIQKQKEFLANILEFLPYPFYVIDANDYTIKLANSAAGSIRVSGNLTCYLLSHRRDTPCTAGGYLCPLDEVKKTKKSVIMEHVHYDKDGNARHVEVYGHPVLDAKGNVVQMIEYSLDITERKRAEEERLQREKLQGVLETAGAACHELNQPIQALFAYAHSLLKRIHETDPLYESVQEIKREIERIAAITRKLNNITRYESEDYIRGTRIININKASRKS
jgi:PAS domain-containing protein